MSNDDKKRIAYQTHRALRTLGELRVLLQQAEHDDLVEELAHYGSIIFERLGSALGVLEPKERVDVAYQMGPESKTVHPYTSPFGERIFPKQSE